MCKMALICKSGVKVRVRDRIRVGLGLAFHCCTYKGHILQIRAKLLHIRASYR